MLELPDGWITNTNLLRRGYYKKFTSREISKGCWYHGADDASKREGMRMQARRFFVAFKNKGVDTSWARTSNGYFEPLVRPFLNSLSKYL
jgi:hypothetical protein